MMVSSVVVTSPPGVTALPRSFASAEAGIAERELARLALVGGDAQPDRPVQTPSRHQEDRPSVLPVGIRLLRDRKIAMRLRRDGAESLGFCGTGCPLERNARPARSPQSRPQRLSWPMELPRRPS